MKTSHDTGFTDEAAETFGNGNRYPAQLPAAMFSETHPRLITGLDAMVKIFGSAPAAVMVYFFPAMLTGLTRKLRSLKIEQVVPLEMSAFISLTTTTLCPTAESLQGY